MSTSFWINLLACGASLVYALTEHGETVEEFRNSKGREKRWKLTKLLFLWLAPAATLVATIFSARESVSSENELKTVAKGLSSTSNELRSTARKLANVEAAIPPRSVSQEQRESFIGILCDGHNVSKTYIEVIAGKADRDTEQFAFKVRKLLDEAGYGENPSPFQLPLDSDFGADVLYVTNVPPRANLPRFDWKDRTFTRIRNFCSLDADGRHVIALFDGEIPSLGGTIPSVMPMVPAESNPARAMVHVYRRNDDPNMILLGVSAVLNEIGISAGKSTIQKVLPPGTIPKGRVALFIPN